MERLFYRSTTKEKCSMLLLSCMNWGCSRVYGSNDEIETKIKKKLKFQYECDILRFRSCIDLIEDTENAILHFSNYGLEEFNPKIGKDFGEIYIKLYGILNAIYLQINSIIEIYEICKMPNKNSVVGEFRKHQIFELRNIMGAHTANFEDKSDYMPQNYNRNSFRITQMQLNAKGNELHAVDSFGNLKEFDLYELVMSYNALSEKVLYNGCVDYMNRIFANSLSKKTELLSHYELINFRNYNYRKLYKNDRLYKKFIKRAKRKIHSEIQDNFEASTHFNINDLIADEIFGIDVLKDLIGDKKA